MQRLSSGRPGVPFGLHHGKCPRQTPAHAPQTAESTGPARALLGRGHHEASHLLRLGTSAARPVALCPQACPRHRPQGLDKSPPGISDFILSPPLDGYKVSSRRLPCHLPGLHTSWPSPQGPADTHALQAQQEDLTQVGAANGSLPSVSRVSWRHGWGVKVLFPV